MKSRLYELYMDHAGDRSMWEKDEQPRGPIAPLGQSIPTPAELKAKGQVLLEARAISILRRIIPVLDLRGVLIDLTADEMEVFDRVAERLAERGWEASAGPRIGEVHIRPKG